MTLAVIYLCAVITAASSLAAAFTDQRQHLERSGRLREQRHRFGMPES